MSAYDFPLLTSIRALIKHTLMRDGHRGGNIKKSVWEVSNRRVRTVACQAEMLKMVTGNRTEAILGINFVSDVSPNIH